MIFLSKPRINLDLMRINTGIMRMDGLKASFIELAIRCNVLRFGQFTLKSGRISPYFFNAGHFYQGDALRQVGMFYADALIKHGVSFDHLFGPAYKGLPLATTTAVALAERGVLSTVTFNRKEIKDHGEGGHLIGGPLTGKTVIIDDVITSGKAFREAQAFILANGGQVEALIIALDRCERGISEKSALSEVAAQGIQVISLITLFDLIDYLQEKNETAIINQLKAYHKTYGLE